MKWQWIAPITRTCLLKYTENFTTKKKKKKKPENFQIKILIFFFIFLLKGGSNEYPQSMFWAEIRKIIYTPVNPNFTK